jgi:hypothetical protein
MSLDGYAGSKSVGEFPPGALKSTNGLFAVDLSRAVEDAVDLLQCPARRHEPVVQRFV